MVSLTGLAIAATGVGWVCCELLVETWVLAH